MRAARRWLAALLGAWAALGSVPASAGELSPRRAQLYQQTCARCHQRADLGAPLAGDRAAWEARHEQGFEALLRHTVLGIRNMPPLGTCGACSEDDLRALVAFLSGLDDPDGAAAPP